MTTPQTDPTTTTTTSTTSADLTVNPQSTLLAAVQPSPSVHNYARSTQAIHADDPLNRNEDVAPALHVSTTFRYADNAEELKTFDEIDMATYDKHVYSRLSGPNSTRFETILSSLLNAQALTYTSGLSAFHAIMVFLNPRRIAITAGYHGVHGVIGLHKKISGLQVLPLDCPAEDLHPGDIVHVETPLNPTGEASSIAAYAAKAHARGAYLVVDATFGPPGLQDPFALGADVVMHSGTKYLGGHSDMLCGVLATKRQDWWAGLWGERLFLGSVMGSLEGWLGVRSLRTLELRVQRQSQNATKIVEWLDSMMSTSSDADSLSNDDRQVKAAVQKSVARIAHASLQARDPSVATWLSKQMPNGYGPVFAIWMQDESFARRLPAELKLFHHATSLGGVESLIEWRRMTDSGVEPTLLRVSIGIEAWEDLRDDLGRGFRALVGAL
ncbi:MAG: hypothetical protein M1819_005496 [Sarea resinae]|nr:MAG: hypothetical protein M1819_005496 [Sarea resinae]